MVFKITLLTFFLSFFASASPFSIAEKSYNLKIGAGIRVKSNIRKDDTTVFKQNDPIIAPFPFIRFKLSRFELEPDRAKIIFNRSLLWDLDIRVHYRGHEYNTFDMDHRHKTLFGGAALRFLLFKFKILKDLQNKSNSEIMIASMVIPAPIGKHTTILLQGDIEFWDSEYIDYYFGVKESESKPGRSAYVGKKDKSYRFQSTFLTRFSGSWMTRINVAYRKYGEQVANSPTVKRSRELDFMTGIVYEF
ncbi:MipA/OmpV family protein [Bacteriovorax sp. Seq25_V]|uniref:MipA/OmpV family protein n=1 Tax=Bacteriovorax sp. Seq25_V TaxID=1201288 RepID=UPI00038A0A32|nr:MipA/OmpV family protein [Bacteriovorax sp. Seq25_V]EQC46034.1 MltA-interacting protein MipA [Bacteriovorax sp. Seq25_V]